MPNIPINFSQGLVTARDASTLKPGELQTAVGCEYRVGTPHVYKQPGRTATGNSFANIILGIHKFSYETGDNKLIAYLGTEPPGRGGGIGGRTGTIYEAAPTTTPNFQSSGLSSLSAGAIPQFSSFNDTWVMCNGSDPNYMREANPVSVDTTGDGNSNWTQGNWRTLGMNPPSVQPAWVKSALATGEAKYPVVDAGGNYTNVNNVRDGDKDTYAYATVNTEGQSLTTTWKFTGVSINDLSEQLTLSITHKASSSVNSINIQASAVDATVDVSWITAKQTIEVSEDGGANWTTIVSSSSSYQQNTTTYVLNTVVAADLTNLWVRAITSCTNTEGAGVWFTGRVGLVVLDNGQSVAEITTTNDMWYIMTERYIDSDGVTHESAASPLSEKLPPDTYGANIITIPSVPVNAHTQNFVIYRSLDAAGQGWPFMYQIAEVPVWDAGGDYIDKIGDTPLDAATGEYYGLTLLRGDEFAYEVLPVLYPTNEQLYTSINGAPPLAKLARLFQGSMVYVPVTGNRIHYSIPTNISSQGAEQVPDLYYLEFLTPLNDNVVSICTANAGRSLIVYFERYSLLVNYLPQATDPGVFDTRISEYISTHRGCGGRLLSIELDVSAGRTIAVAVDKLGVWSTDGVSALQEWSRDLDWDTLMSGVDLTIAELVDNPEMRRIELLYTDTSGDRQELHFFYGRLKQDIDGNQSPYITGPHPMGVRCHHYNLDEDGAWQGWSGGAGGAATLTPTGMDMWLIADDLNGVVSDGATLSSWTSNALGSGSYTYDVGGAPPSFHENQLNGHDAVRTATGSKSISTPFAPNFTGEFTVAVVYKQGVSNAFLFGSNQTSGNNRGISWPGDGFSVGTIYYESQPPAGADANGAVITKFMDPIVGSYHVAIARRDSSEDNYIYFDGRDETLGTPYNSGDATDTLDMRRLFGLDGDSLCSTGCEIFEIIEWRSYFTDSQVIGTSNYLTDKYGLTDFDTTTSDVYIERSGDEDAAFGYDANGNIPFQVKTGEMYLGNLGRAAMTIFGFPKFEGSTTKALDGSSTQAIEGTFRRDGAASATTKTKTYTVNSQKKIYWSQYADRHAFEVRDISNTSLPALVGYEIEVREGGPSRDK